MPRQRATPGTPADPWEARLLEEWRRLNAEAPDRSSAPTERSLTPTGPSPTKRGLTPTERDIAVRELLSLQRGLTGERARIGQAYMDEDASLGAYLLFYWSVSRAQTQGILSMAFPGGPSAAFSHLRSAASPGAAATLRFLDLGSGPGPCGIGAAEWLRDGADGQQDIELTLYDRSAKALRAAAALAKTIKLPLEQHPRWDAQTSPLPRGPFDMVILGHVLNELWKDSDDRVERRFERIKEIGAELSPSGIMLILEPALLSTSRDTLALRDRLTAAGWSILAPCFRDGPCPALEQAGHTCHSDFSWTMPGMLRELADRTGLNKDILKTTAFVVTRAGALPADAGVASAATGGASETVPPIPGPVVPTRRYRVVSEPMLNKAGRIRLLLCGQDGRFPLSAKPGEGFKAEAAFLRLRRSDRVDLRSALPRENGFALGPETELETGLETGN